MQGRWIYYALSSLLGLLVAFISPPFLFMFGAIIYLVFLYKWKCFLKRELLIITIFFLVFFLKGTFDANRNQTHFDGSEKQFEVVFEDEVKIDGNLLLVYGKDQSGEKLQIKYRLKTEKEKYLYENIGLVGSSCQVNGSLKSVRSATNENSFDYQAYLNNRQIHWQLMVNKWGGCKTGAGPIIFIKEQRQQALAIIEERFPSAIASLCSALLFGERKLLDPSLEGAYQKLGIIHLLAISGLHVGLLNGILYYIGIRVGGTKERVITALLLYLPIFIYLSGASPSVIRASMMTMLVLINNRFLHQKMMTIDILSIVFICCLFFNPFLLFDIGFQLSFGVCTALLLSAKKLLSGSRSPISLLLKTSFISQVCSLPFIIHYFFEFSILSLAANLFYIPLFSTIILPLLLGLFLIALFFGDKVSVLVLPINFVLCKLNDLTIALASIPFQTIILGRPTRWIELAFAISIVITLCIWEKKKRRKEKLPFLIFPIALLFICDVTNHYSLKGEITFIDVGQGDSILIQQGFKKETVLIDTGGTVNFAMEDWKKQRDPFEVGKDVLVPYLKSKGIHTIDKLVLTHGDLDHIGGARAILEAMNIKELVLPALDEQSELEKELITLAVEKETHIIYVKNGISWQENGVVYQVLNPIDEHSEKNNGSIVLYAKVGGLYWLFTGDLEAEGEEKLLQKYPELQVDVLKIGHHGSKTSTSEDLLDSYKPKVAIISVGEKNRFGHPHQEVLARLEERNIKVFRTDKDGAITYFFRNRTGTFSTKKPYDRSNP